MELAIVENLEDVLDQLRKAGVRRAAFGSIALEFDGGGIVATRSQPLPVNAPAPQVDERLAQRPGYANLFGAGAPGFAPAIEPQKPVKS